MSIFGYDGFFAQVIRYAWKLFLLNVCFLICCIPVVTIGAALSALYSVFLNESLESGTVGPYFRAFKQNFKKGTLIWVAFALAGGLIGVNFYCLYAYNVAGGNLVRVMLALLTALYLSVLSFVFPLQARYENPVGRTIRNAVILGLSMLPSGLLMVLAAVYPLILFLLDVDIFVSVIGIWLLVGCSSSAQISAWIAARAFSKVEKAGAGE